MFDVSWGELVVLTGIGLSLVGRKDLPRMANVFGTQVGRIVGMLQGARARADRFAAQNELRQLQNELRAGLRELDAVKSEMAVAASGPGLLGRSLGATVGSAERVVGVSSPAATTTTGAAALVSGSKEAMTTTSSSSSSPPTTTMGVSGAVGISSDSSATPFEQPSSSSNDDVIMNDDVVIRRELAPRSHAVAAVAEEEWVKQGIGFRSRAEQQGGVGSDGSSGSTILANLLQQTLIHDQYDRVVQEQEEALRSRADQIQQKRKRGGEEKDKR